MTGGHTAPPASSSLEWSLLAAAVVRQAMLDASSPTLPRDERQRARRFLEGDSMYRFWSEVATLGLRDLGTH